MGKARLDEIAKRVHGVSEVRCDEIGIELAIGNGGWILRRGDDETILSLWEGVAWRDSPLPLSQNVFQQSELS